MFKHSSRFLALFVVFSLALAFGSTGAFAQSDQGLAARQFGHGQPANVSDLPPGQLKRRLESLPPQARGRALRWLQDFEFTGGDLDLLQVDDEGGVLFADTLLPNPAPAGASSGATAELAELTSALDPANVFQLHSKPGAPTRVFIDFDGHVITATAWNSGTAASFQARPFDLDGNPSSFNETERRRIADIWHRVAEDLAPFDIDVTTEAPASMDRYTGRILVTHSQDATGIAMPHPSAGGVAYVNVFGATNYHTYYSPALVYYNNLGGGVETYVAEASSHEFGHNLGLSHDGTKSGTTYYAGHGSGLVSWAPTMGNSYYNNVTQWSRGEYPDANNLQDDLAIISAKLGWRGDDHGDTIGSGTALVVGGDGSVVSSNPELDPHNELPANKGVIDASTDLDVFTFNAGSGPLSLVVTPAWDAFYRSTSRRGANLDIRAELRNSSGTLIASSDPTTDTQATVAATVSAGTYHLLVKAIGNTTVPYSNYNSFGQYFINGSMATGTVDTTAPTPNPMSWATPPTALSVSEISMTARTASDETSSVQYRFSCVSGGTGCVSSSWQASSSWSLTGLAGGTQYTFTVAARDASGNQTASSAPASATTQTPPPPPPPPPPAPEGDFVATSSTTISGSVSGSYTNTHADDSSTQAITEVLSGGKPNSRYSYLEHRWVFALGAGATTTVLANAWSGGSSDGDSFRFEYSLNGGSTWQAMFTVSSTSSSNKQSFQLPGNPSGTLLLRVVDTNRSRGATQLNKVYIDHLLIQTGETSSEPPPPPPPTATLSLQANGYKVKGMQQADLDWTGASSVDIYRNGGRIASAVSGSGYTDAIGSKGGGTWQYRVCVAGTTSDCSNIVTVTL